MAYEPYRGNTGTAEMTTVNNVAVDTRANQAVATRKTTQKLDIKTTMRAVITCGADAKTDVPIITGSGVSSALLAGLTYAGDFDTFPELQEMIKNSKFRVAKLRLQTTDTDNFQAELIKGDRKLNNKNNTEETVYLSEYAKSVGDGYAPNLEVYDFDFLIGPRSYLTLSRIEANSSITFMFDVVEVEESADLQTV